MEGCRVRKCLRLMSKDSQGRGRWAAGPWAGQMLASLAFLTHWVPRAVCAWCWSRTRLLGSALTWLLHFRARHPEASLSGLLLCPPARRFSPLLCRADNSVLGYPVLCRMFSSFPGLYPPAAGSVPLSQVMTTSKALDIAKYLPGIKLTLTPAPHSPA